MKNSIINNRARQVKRIFSRKGRLMAFWIGIIFIMLSITLLRSRPVGSRPAFDYRRSVSPAYNFFFAEAGRVRAPGPAGIIVSSSILNRADGPVKPDVAVPHQPENDLLQSGVSEIKTQSEGPAAIESRRPFSYDWLDELLNNIWAIESGGRTNPPDGDAGQAIGPLQIHKEVLLDVNRHYGTKFTINDLREIEKAKLVARIYIEMWMDRHKEEIAARIFNGGPRGWQSKNTDEYWSKINGR
jgi:hypothetical protein